MIWFVEDRSDFTIQSWVEKIVATGQLSRREHMQLASTILADYQLTDADRRRINRILDYVQVGRLKLVN